LGCTDSIDVSRKSLEQKKNQARWDKNYEFEIIENEGTAIRNPVTIEGKSKTRDSTGCRALWN